MLSLAAMKKLDIPYTTTREWLTSACPRKLSKMHWKARIHRTLAPCLALPIVERHINPAVLKLAHSKLFAGQGAQETSWHNHSRVAFRAKLLTSTPPTMAHKNRYWPVQYPVTTCPFADCEDNDDVDHALTCPAMPEPPPIELKSITAEYYKLRSKEPENRAEDRVRAETMLVAMRESPDQRMIMCGYVEETVLHEQTNSHYVHYSTPPAGSPQIPPTTSTMKTRRTHLRRPRRIGRSQPSSNS
ncbi:hypothetical protein BC828DRAFT_138627 [Blastocladiella britannica]|nr:hypothetical protein BC828DRAFT_138627 [Blastocladiella britannica]